MPNRPSRMSGVNEVMSPGSRLSRNHHASIGTGASTGRSPARSRARDSRPSQATVSSARSVPVAPSRVR